MPLNCDSHCLSVYNIRLIIPLPMFSRVLNRGFWFAQSKFNSYKDVTLLNSELSKNYMRSSGPGGQSVNTTNSKAEVRVLISSCSIIDSVIADNLRANYPNFINKSGEIVVTSQTHKSQAQNLNECIKKIQKLIFNCSQVPEQRKYEIPTETEEMEDRRIEGKKKRSEVKGRRNLGNRKHDL